MLAQKGWSKQQVRDADPWWVRNVVFYPHEKDGSLTPMQDEEKPVEEMSPKEKFAFGYRRRGFPEWRIEELWDEQVKHGGSSSISTG